MLLLLLGTLGTLVLAASAGAYAQQALIDDAKAKTGGYF
jgi:hypothetical protein